LSGGWGVKRQRDETDHLRPPNVEVKNKWSCTSSASYMSSQRALGLIRHGPHNTVFPVTY